MPKLGKLMEAFILAGLVQLALDAQDVFGPRGGAAFSIKELDDFLRAEWTRASLFYQVHSDLHGHTEPLMRACYLFVKEPCSASLNCTSVRL